MEQERIWDYTTISTFQACPKKYYFRMIKHLVPTTTAPALLFGKALHSALEVFYKDIREGKDRATALASSIKIFQDNYETPEGEEKRTTENAIKLLKGYEEVYRNEPFKVLGQEIGFAVPVFYKDSTGVEKSFLLCGRLDALIDWNGVLYVLEHKTTTMLGANYFYQFEMSMQVDGYVYAASQHTGRKCLGAVVNALEVWKDVKKETSKTKKLEDHYARDPISRSDYELSEYLKDAGEWVERIIDSEKRNSFPRHKGACFTYNYKCPYWDICKYGEDEKIIGRTYKVEKWEPYKQPNGGDNGNT